MALKYYKDRDLNYPIDMEKGAFLGKIKAGEKKQFTFWVYNDYVYALEEMVFSTDREDIKIVQAPTEMQEKTKAELILDWVPSVSIERGLRTKVITDFYKVIEG